MRILTVGSMYPPHHLGGYELMWESYVRHERAGGNEVRALCSDYRAPDPDRTVGGGDEDEGVSRDLRWYWRDHGFPRLGPGARLRLERHNIARLERELAEFRPDAVCWWAMGGMSMSLVELVRRAGVPAAGAVVDDWLCYGPEVDGWQRMTARWAATAAVAERSFGVPTRLELDSAARWLFISETTRRRARGAGRRGEGRIAHGGIDRALFPAAPARTWNWRLLYVGRIDRRKGVATAVRAVAELPAARLTIVGGGDEEHRAELEGLISRLGVGDRVSFQLHPRTALGRVYADADAVLFPVVWEEPWGLVPLEGMSVGRPVVATGTGGSGEYLRDGENCLLFAPHEDPTALASAVVRLAGDEALRDRLRRAGFATAERFTERAFNVAVGEEVRAAAAAA